VPFSGTASFSSTSASSAEWTEDLMVELPGAGLVQLTGLQFRSQLCLGRACVDPLGRAG
jgi:hypothetical protein